MFLWYKIKDCPATCQPFNAYICYFATYILQWIKNYTGWIECGLSDHAVIWELQSSCEQCHGELLQPLIILHHCSRGSKVLQNLTQSPCTYTYITSTWVEGIKCYLALKQTLKKPKTCWYLFGCGQHSWLLQGDFLAGVQGDSAGCRSA